MLEPQQGEKELFRTDRSIEWVLWSILLIYQAGVAERLGSGLQPIYVGSNPTPSSNLCENAGELY